jgi:predicted permease
MKCTVSNDSNLSNVLRSGGIDDENVTVAQNSMIPVSKQLKQSIVSPPREFFNDSDSFYQSIKHACKQCLQPPVVGSLLGLIAAMTPIRGYFVDIKYHRSQAPLQWLFDGLYSVGRTSIPINMMVLGCNLSASFHKNEIYTTSSKEGQFSFTTLNGIVVGKMLILPIIGLLSVVLLKNFVLNVDDSIDGALYLVMLIVFVCPTANNVMVMVELSGSDAKDSIARVIGIQYAVAPFILIITMTISILFAGVWS